MFKKWEDYTELEQAAVLYSDFYKSVNGPRPRFDQSHWTLEDYDRAMDDLQVDSDREMANKRIAEQAAVNELEAAITLTMATCSCDRETAWRYLKDAEGDDWYDDGYFEYSYNLPRGYLASTELEEA